MNDVPETRIIDGKTWVRRELQDGDIWPAATVIAVDKETGKRYAWVRLDQDNQ